MAQWDGRHCLRQYEFSFNWDPWSSWSKWVNRGVWVVQCLPHVWSLRDKAEYDNSRVSLQSLWWEFDFLHHLWIMVIVIVIKLFASAQSDWQIWQKNHCPWRSDVVPARVSYSLDFCYSIFMFSLSSSTNQSVVYIPISYQPWVLIYF